LGGYSAGSLGLAPLAADAPPPGRLAQTPLTCTASPRLNTSASGERLTPPAGEPGVEAEVAAAAWHLVPCLVAAHR
jgi:hypothetical protein